MCPFTVRLTKQLTIADFLGGMITRTIPIPKNGLGYSQVQLNVRICLHVSTSTPFNALFRQCATVSRPRLHFSRSASYGILTVSSIAYAYRLRLRDRLTPGRLTLPGKPWSYGGEDSRLPNRYLYLHLLFATLQRQSPDTFNTLRMLPYRYFLKCYPAPSVVALYPIIIHARSLD